MNADSPERGKTITRCPVIIVGLPRSGTTLLTRILNESPHLFIVDDLYYLQEAQALGAFEKSDPSIARRLATFLVDRIRARTAGDSRRRFEKSLILDAKAIADIEEYALSLASEGFGWSELLCRVLTMAATFENKTTWGYKTPQDYLHMARIRKAYPLVRFIFIVRDPYDTLRSYKNVLGLGHDPARYHPIIQSWHWRLCATTYFDNVTAMAEDVILIRYEDLVNFTEETLLRIGHFLKSPVPLLHIESLGTNTAYGMGRRYDLTETELWLCDLVLSRTKIALGYEGAPHRPHIEDLPEVLRLTAKCFSFYLASILTSANLRARVRNFLTSSLEKATGNRGRRLGTHTGN